jgi:uncharacterized protein (TIGR02231 family)
MRLLAAFVAVSVPLLASSAFAAEIAVPSVIDAVSVHPRSAYVTRALETDLKAGASTLVLKGVPAGVDAASIRIEGTGENVSVLGSDFRTTIEVPKPTANPERDARAEVLRIEIENLRGEIEQAETLKAMTGRYAEASPADMKTEQKSFDVTNWLEAWTAVSNQLKVVDERLRTATRALNEREDELARIEAAQPSLAPDGPQHEILVQVDARGAAHAKLRVSYQVGGASWLPAYEARLTTGAEPKISLERRAIVTQTTGEDWNGVALTVHTSDTEGRTSAPDIMAWRVVAGPHLTEQVRGGARAKTAYDSAELSAAAPAPASEPAPQVAQAEAEILNTGYTTSFVIPGRVSVSADGAKKTLLISSREETPSLRVETTPGIDAAAYVQAAFRLGDATPLFPGTVALYRDGALVGREAVALSAPGEEIELGFGRDERVRVEHMPVARHEQGPRLFGDRKTDTQSFKTVVTNFHDTPVSVRVLNRIPFSENDAVEVREGEISPEPTAKNFRDIRGALAWDFQLAPQGKQEIALGYSVSWPQNGMVRYQDMTN